MYILKDEKGRNYSEYSHEEYHNTIDALNNSKLKKFYESPDSYFIETKNKIEFELGKAFEDLVHQKVFGNTDFKDKFYVDQDGNMDRPGDSLDIIKDIKNFKYSAESLIQKNKGGSLKKNGKNKWLQVLMIGGGKFPLKFEEFQMLDLMSDNFLKMKWKGLSMRYIIENSIIERPFVSVKNGLKKKCKPDLLFTADGIIYLIDIKTFGKSVVEFNWQVKNLSYWIQAAHYREVVQEHYDQSVEIMRFAVASKQEPNLSMMWEFTDKKFYGLLETEYNNLCEVFKKWSDEGKKKIGYIEKTGSINFRVGN